MPPPLAVISERLQARITDDAGDGTDAAPPRPPPRPHPRGGARVRVGGASFIIGLSGTHQIIRIVKEEFEMTLEKTTKRPGRLRFGGRVLYLAEDVSLIRRQLAEGVELEYDPARALMNNISTDEITPGWVCFYYDETLGEYVYVGMREGAVKKDEVKRGGFAVVVSGLSKGCGSSRETAPYAEKAAGVQLVIAKSIEKIYGQNSQNIGLLTSTDLGLVERIRLGEEIPLAEFTKGLDPISQEIVAHGGLFNYNKARLTGRVTPPPIETVARPMTIVEKIIARHAFVSAGTIGVEAVKPGDALFAVAD